MKPARIQSTLWSERLEVNARAAIFHQWEQLVASGCIENFRIAAGESHGWREGWFFADSDAYKWLDAAARIYANWPDPRLSGLMDDFIALISRAQCPDGYIFTYNQIHFPGQRWQNLQIEHELYCHGHLIEAGVSHYQATGRADLLAIAARAADRIVADFAGKGPAFTPGHEEIEIALLRLHQMRPAGGTYLNLARQFIEQRGRSRLFALSLLKQNQSVAQRGKWVQQKKAEYLAQHPGFQPFQVPPGNRAVKPRFATLRWQIGALRGQYFQQHKHIRQQTEPVGHAVRFGYLETAAAMLVRESGDRSLLPALEQTWECMVTRRMYVTGGLGSQPGSEGFGRDYELNPEYGYNETCAALASMFWSWEMAGLTGEARYSDLFEWQLYNAAGVGMGLDGTSYLYNNPLACRGGITRKPWYAVPCCPSNLSRTWADLGRYIYSMEKQVLRIHQWIGSALPDNSPLGLEMESELPWIGRARLRITAPAEPAPLEIQLRHPSWAQWMNVSLNGEPALTSALPQTGEPTASSYDPRAAQFVPIRRAWRTGDVLDVEFDLSVQLRHAHPKVKGHQGKAALTRGPLVYCLESLDNPGVDIFTARLDPASLNPEFDETLLGGCLKITAQTSDGKALTFIPYYLWGNRGPSQMTVWVNA